MLHGYRTKLPSGKEYWEALNLPSILYTGLIQTILAAGVHPTNVEPITGHGLQKLMRPKKNFSYVIEKMLPVPEIFSFVEKAAKISPAEMIKIFNYGVGYAIFTRTQTEAERVILIAKRHKLKAIIAGRVAASKKREVVVKPLNAILKGDSFSLTK